LLGVMSLLRSRVSSNRITHAATSECVNDEADLHGMTNGWYDDSDTVALKKARLVDVLWRTMVWSVDFKQWIGR